MSDQVERIVRALQGIENETRHAAACTWMLSRGPCNCDRVERVRARQAAAVLEALSATYAAGHPRFIEALERLAGSPRDKEETPNE